MLVMVTGGSGFIGTHLCEELNQKGYDCLVYDKKKPSNRFCKYVEGDIRDFVSLKQTAKDCETIYHLGGLLGTEYLTNMVRDAVETNILGTINVFEVAKEKDIKVINSGVIPNWLNPYMLTKKTVCRFGEMYSEIYATEVITLEVSHVYGPNQPVEPYFKAIPTFINNALQNENIKIFGDGNRLMDCLYVKDAARGIRLAGQKSGIGGITMSMSSDYSISVLDLAKKIIHLTGSKSKLIFEKMRVGEPIEISAEEMIVNKHSAKDILNWDAEIDIQTGLLNSIEWYAQNSYS